MARISVRNEIIPSQKDYVIGTWSFWLGDFYGVKVLKWMKVHSFRLLPFTVILNDRFDKVLKVLRFLASA